MTSEIALYNKNSVALAADSAVAWGNKVYNTTEKIYQLAGRQPVGFMTYGMGAYMGMQWGRVFGAYRQFLGAQEKKGEAKELPKIQSHPDEYWGPERKYRRYESVQDWSPPPRDKDDPMTNDGKGEDWDSLGYVEHFLHFLELSEFAISHLSDNEDSERLRIEELVEFVAHEIPLIWTIERELIEPRISMVSKSTKSSLGKDISNYNKALELLLKTNLSDKAEEHFEKLNKKQKRRHKGLLIHETKILNKVVEKVDKMVGKKIKITQKMRIDIRKLTCVFLTIGRRPVGSTTGLIVAGFGKEEVKPKVIHLLIHWKWRGELKVMRINDGKAFREDYESANAETYAQAGMVNTLIDGRHPQWDRAISWSLRTQTDQFISDIARRTKGISEDGRLAKRLASSARSESFKFSDSIITQARSIFTDPDDDLELTIGGTQIKPDLKYRNFLPFHIYRLAPSDLASLAEKLVEVEVSFQYVVEAIRGVGGAVDVASITKENGFMWVKRMDTFDPALNPRTHHNRRKSAQHI